MLVNDSVGTSARKSTPKKLLPSHRASSVRLAARWGGSTVNPSVVHPKPVRLHAWRIKQVVEVSRETIDLSIYAWL